MSVPPPTVENSSEEKEMKSFLFHNPRLQYCTDHSVSPHPAQIQLQDATLAQSPKYIMLGAPEILHYCSSLIKLIKGKRCLDIGCFTGASALAWALAIPDDGQVITMDVNDENYKNIGLPIIKTTGLEHKIELRVQGALKTLDELIAAGEEGTWDFAFVDAVKTEYSDYFEKCMVLLRPGGVIAVDNSLWFNRVCKEIDPKDKETIGIDACNKKIHKDSRVIPNLLPIGDGLMVAFKL